MTVEGGRIVAYEGQSDSVDKGVQPDGRRLWRFSQSLLKQVDACPERGRRAMLRLADDYATDSNATGRAIHTAIELSVQDMIDGQGPWALHDMIAIAIEEFNEEMALPSSRYVKYKTAETLHKQIDRMLTTWYQRVLPTLQPVAVEVNFGPLIIHEDEQRIIEVRGQIDYIDKLYVGDWKTTGRAWEPWEHQRWDVQPTMYLGALELQEDRPWGDFRPWTWHVLNTDGTYQMIETSRGVDDWMWLKDRCVTIAKLLEADLDEWPKNDTSALCGSTWCNSFDACKGRFVGVPWPKKRA